MTKNGQLTGDTDLGADCASTDLDVNVGPYYVLTGEKGSVELTGEDSVKWHWLPPLPST